MKKYDSEWMAEYWTKEYDKQAQSCTDEWGNSVLGMKPNDMKSKLIIAFNKGIDGTNILTDISLAIDAYWTGTTLSTMIPPDGGISGISNSVSGFGDEFTIPVDLLSSINDGAKRLADDGLFTKTKQIQTTYVYLKAGSPPTIDIKYSTLR